MASNFNPLNLIGSGIGGAFQYAGAKKQADAATHAADLQSQAAQAALEFTKGVKAKQEAAAAPYLSLGQMATGALPGAVRPSPSGAPPTPYGTAPGAMPQGQQTGFSLPSGAPPAYGFSAYATDGGVPAGSTPVRMVQLQAPDGTMRQVPPNLVQPFLDRGAKVVS